jgi:tripartite motif-containing protein 23
MLVSSQVPGTAENARSCVRAYFSDLHETLCRQEEMALSVVDAHVREKLIWLRQQQEDMTILLSQVSTACLHCEKTLQQVGNLMWLGCLLMSSIQLSEICSSLFST